MGATLTTCAAALAASAALFAARPSAAAGDDADYAQALAGFLGVWESGPRPGGPGGPPNGRPPRGGDGGPPPRLGRGGPPRLDASVLAPREGEPEGLDDGDRIVRARMTPEGQAAFDAMDPREHPANNCISPGLPAIAGAPGLQEWSLDGDVLTIRHEYYSTTRTIRLGGVHPEDAPHTHEGDAIGWIDGDELVIETTQLAATLGGLARNAPASDAREVVERYSLSADGDALLGQMVLMDAKYLTRPLMRPLLLARAAAGATVEFFPCSIEAAQHYLNE